MLSFSKPSQVNAKILSAGELVLNGQLPRPQIPNILTWSDSDTVRKGGWFLYS